MSSQRKVKMSHICKVEVSHFPVDLTGLECVCGIGDHVRSSVLLDPPGEVFLATEELGCATDSSPVRQDDAHHNSLPWQTHGSS